MLPPSKIPPPPTVAQTSSLDDAVNAPTRVTRTKTRAMAKAAAEVDKVQKPQVKYDEIFNHGEIKLLLP